MMLRYDKRQTATTFAQRVALENGQTISREWAGWVVWNRTGWPQWWEGEPWPSFDKQLSDYFARIYHCGRCGRVMPDDDGGLNLCEPCAEVM